MDHSLRPSSSESYSWLRLAFAAASVLFLSAALSAQGNQIGLRMNEVQRSQCDSGLGFDVKVTDEKKKPLDRQAVVKYIDQTRVGITGWQTTADDGQTLICNLQFGNYDIEVSALGYLTAHQQVQFTPTLQTVNLDIFMHKDPAAVDLDAANETVPPNLRKDVKRALYSLKSADYKNAQKQLDKVARTIPNNPQINFLYGFLFLQQNDAAKAETYLAKAEAGDPHREQTLTLLGRVQLMQKHPEDAVKTLEQAVLANAQSWMAHNLLGDAYLQQKDFEKARQQAELAIQEGKSAANSAQLVLGQALADVGRDQEAILALKTFLQGDPNNPAKPQVESVISELEKRDTSLTGITEIKTESDLALTAAPPSLPESAWGPPGVDDVTPGVAAGVACPAQDVLNASGERVKEMVDNITRFAAIEDLLHEQLDQTGHPITKETRKFDYVASITESQPGVFATDEYRNVRYGTADLPDHIVTRGFVTLALIFHPDMRDNFEMTCEGLGEWHGQATWLVHFRQRDHNNSQFADYTLGAQTYPMKLKGRAWLTVKDFEIVRIESDLESPLPRLPIQHQIAEYGPVHFASKNLDLWLPTNVDLYFELNRQRYHRRHSFEHYMLFSVNSDEKATPPTTKKASSKPVTNP